MGIMTTLKKPTLESPPLPRRAGHRTPKLRRGPHGTDPRLPQNGRCGPSPPAPCWGAGDRGACPASQRLTTATHAGTTLAARGRHARGALGEGG
jgi:hypothetical protein